MPQQWFCDLVWAGRTCGRQNLTPNTGSASEHVCASCGGARLPPYYILQHIYFGWKLVLGYWRQLPRRYGFGCNRQDWCYFQHGVEAQQWKRVASAMSIREADTYVNSDTYQQLLPSRKRHSSEMDDCTAMFYETCVCWHQGSRGDKHSCSQASPGSRTFVLLGTFATPCHL